LKGKYRFIFQRIFFDYISEEEERKKHGLLCCVALQSLSFLGVHSLPTTHYQPLITNHSLPTTHYQQQQQQGQMMV
jgi:hypothetical protein